MRQKKRVAQAVGIDKQNVNALSGLPKGDSTRKHRPGHLEYKRAIEVAPNIVQLYVTLGSIYEEQGNWQAAHLYIKKL